MPKPYCDRALFINISLPAPLLRDSPQPLPRHLLAARPPILPRYRIAQLRCPARRLSLRARPAAHTLARIARSRSSATHSPTPSSTSGSATGSSPMRNSSPFSHPSSRTSPPASATPATTLSSGVPSPRSPSPPSPSAISASPSSRLRNTARCSRAPSPTCATSATRVASTPPRAGSTPPPTPRTCLPRSPRSPRFTPADQQTLFAAVEQRLTSAGRIYTYGEQDRLAVALLVVITRDDFQLSSFQSWLTSVQQDSIVWQNSPPDPVRLALFENHTYLLEALLARMPSRTPLSPAAAEARDAAREALRSR